MRDGHSLFCTILFSVILSLEENDWTFQDSLNIFVFVYHHETQLQWRTCSLYPSALYEIWPVIRTWLSSLSDLFPFLKASCLDLFDKWMHFPDMLSLLSCIFFPFLVLSLLWKEAMRGEEMDCIRSSKAENCWMIWEESRGLRVKNGVIGQHNIMTSGHDETSNHITFNYTCLSSNTLLLGPLCII